MKMLAVHPNFELYGSDRSFANALSAILDFIPGVSIDVFLPKSGPILTLPVFGRVKTIINDFWIPRRADISISKLPVFLYGGAKYVYRAVGVMKKYDLVYINTVICLDFMIASRFCGKKVVIHVREIPLGMEMRVFRFLLIYSRAVLVFNSIAARSAFRLPENIAAHVVYNGSRVPKDYVREYYNGSRPLRVMVIGRINLWKGQEILVDAIAAMSEEKRRSVEVRFVGGVFGDQDHFRDELQAHIMENNLGNIISIHPFTDDPTDAYCWADVVVVPSIRPEPFGRVAIEAMAFRCPVIGSAHGGLVEIIENDVTGLLTPPSDAVALCAAVEAYIDDPLLVSAHGEAGFSRFMTMFTDEVSNRAVALLMEEVIADAGARQATSG